MDQKKRQTHAAALKYDAGKDSAPCIVGLGEGYVAQKILETAADHEIPVVEDETLANVLSSLSVGDEIPEELYQVIAEVLVFIARMDSQSAGRFTLEEIQKRKHR